MPSLLSETLSPSLTLTLPRVGNYMSIKASGKWVYDLSAGSVISGTLLCCSLIRNRLSSIWKWSSNLILSKSWTARFSSRRETCKEIKIPIKSQDLPGVSLSGAAMPWPHWKSSANKSRISIKISLKKGVKNKVTHAQLRACSVRRWNERWKSS